MSNRDDTGKYQEELLSKRLRPDALSRITAGIYIWFAADHARLAMLELGEHRILYIGMTADNSGARNHFEHEDSGFSSPRRSLGALLKDELGLTAIPRGLGASARNYTNYRFADDGEARLRAWMVGNLLANHVALSYSETEIEELETALIRTLAPPLNIKGAPKNQNRVVMQNARRRCREEARASQSERRGGT